MSRYSIVPVRCIVITSFLTVALTWLYEAAAADYMFTNAKVYTVDPEQPWAEAVLVDGNTITFVGLAEDARSQINSDTTVIDLGGRMMLPGMIDTHVHPGVAGLASSLGVTLNRNMSVTEYLDAIKAYAMDNPDAPVIAGFGFIPPLFGPGGPTKEILDDVVSDRPIFIISGFGHSAWANSKALEVLGIDKNTPDPVPGAHFYRRDEEGEPTGHLVEGGAFWSHLDELGIGTPEQLVKGYENTLPEYASVGITSFFDAGTPDVQENAFIALRQLELDDKLPVRYHGSYYVIGDDEFPIAVKEIKRLRETYNSELLRVSAIKVSNDGQSPEPRKPHLLWNGDKLGTLFTEVSVASEDVMIHATNARTVHETLNGIEVAKTAHPETDSRFTIAHMDFVADADFDRFAHLDVIAGVQQMAAETGFIGSAPVPKGIRVNHFRSLMGAGVVVSGSSDFPACGAPLSGCTPFYGIEIAVTRQSIGKPDAPVLAPASERLTLEQAISTYTMESAYQIRRENDLGSIKAGKLADLIVVDQNLFNIEPYSIHKTQVLFTMMNGKILHDTLQ